MLYFLQVLNIQVPFFFKYAVDHFNSLPPLTSPQGTIITMGTALLLGCQLVLGRGGREVCGRGSLCEEELVGRGVREYVGGGVQEGE